MGANLIPERLYRPPVVIELYLSSWVYLDCVSSPTIFALIMNKNYAILCKDALVFSHRMKLYLLLFNSTRLVVVCFHILMSILSLFFCQKPSMKFQVYFLINYVIIRFSFLI